MTMKPSRIARAHSRKQSLSNFPYGLVLLGMLAVRFAALLPHPRMKLGGKRRNRNPRDWRSARAETSSNSDRTEFNKKARATK